MADLICGIDHPAIAAKDAPGLAKWYVETLGFKISATAENGTHILGSPDGVFLEIMPEDGSPKAPRSVFTQGMSHLALRVKDYDAAEKALEAAGIKWTNPQGKAVGGGVLRNFLDPEGNILQIVQR